MSDSTQGTLSFQSQDSTEGEISRFNGNPRVCADCKGPLTGRQERFCSDRCRIRWWDGQHPRVGVVPEGKRETSLLLAVVKLLEDGEWWTKGQLAEVLRAREHSIGTRISEAKASGYAIESDAANGNSRRAHRFRLLGRT